VTGTESPHDLQEPTRGRATVARRGYRFVGSVAPLDEISVLGRPGVAVLPIVDFSGTTGTRLADYLTQDVITALSRFRSLRVGARSSTAQFTGGSVAAREVADRLGVQYVVEGSFRRLGNRMRFSFQLIDGATGATVWADNLPLPLTDGVGDTDELAGRAAAAIESQVQEVSC
jgi:TolB-like protein